MTDDNDRRLLMCTLNKCYSADVLSDVYAFTSSSFYMSPPDGDQQSYMDYIRNLPQTGGAGKGGRAEKAWEGYFIDDALALTSKRRDVKQQSPIEGSRLGSVRVN